MSQYARRNPVRHRLTRKPRPCPVARCHNPVAAGAVLCRECWTKVPVAVQRELWRELGESQKLRGFTPGYRQARAAAIKFAGGEVRLPYVE